MKNCSSVQLVQPKLKDKDLKHLTMFWIWTITLQNQLSLENSKMFQGGNIAHNKSHCKTKSTIKKKYHANGLLAIGDTNEIQRKFVCNI